MLAVVCCIALLSRRATNAEFSWCYDDTSICLWTDGIFRTHSAAQLDCQQRASLFLPRVTNSAVQSKLADFRARAWDLVNGNHLWIDVSASGIASYRWIDGAQFAGS